jgi:hypothetical protein
MIIIKVVNSPAVQQEIAPRTISDFLHRIEVEHAIHEGFLDLSTISKQHL